MGRITRVSQLNCEVAVEGHQHSNLCQSFCKRSTKLLKLTITLCNDNKQTIDT